MIDKLTLDSFIGSFKPDTPSSGVVFLPGHKVECVYAKYHPDTENVIILEIEGSDEIYVDSDAISAFCMPKKTIKRIPVVVFDADAE